MTIVRHILDKKGQFVWTIRPDDTVFAAIEEMARKDVGALVVVDPKKSRVRLLPL